LVAGLFALRLTAGPLGSGWDRIQVIVFFPAYLLAAPFILVKDFFGHYFWPRTVEEAVDRVIGWLDRKSRQRLQEMSEDELALLHFDLGLSIRNEFGLWAGNKELLRDCGCVGADAASGVILARVIRRLRGNSAA
jgi:hypothetical protein